MNNIPIKPATGSLGTTRLPKTRAYICRADRLRPQPAALLIIKHLCAATEIAVGKKMPPIPGLPVEGASRYLPRPAYDVKAGTPGSLSYGQTRGAIGHPWFCSGLAPLYP